MLIIENFLAGIQWPGPYRDLDLEANYINDGLAHRHYNRLVQDGNAVFDT